jgi:hypothetical protein
MDAVFAAICEEAVRVLRAFVVVHEGDPGLTDEASILAASLEERVFAYRRAVADMRQQDYERGTE